MASRARARPGTSNRPVPGGELACLPWQRLATRTEAWDDLARRAAEPNPFYESWYLLPSLAGFDGAGTGAGSGAVSVLCFARGCELLGLMPIARSPQYEGWPLAHVGNWLHPNIFSGTPLVAAGAETDFWRAVLGWADDNPGLALFLHLGEIALDGPVYGALTDVLAEQGRDWGIVECKERAQLASDLSADAYLGKALSARKRKDLNRRLRRLSEIGAVELCWECGADGLDRWTDEFLALEASGWKGEAGSALTCDPATEALFRGSLAGAAARDRLIRLSLRVDGKPVAMLSNFLAPPGAFGFKTAFDEDYARFAPGLLLEREFLDVLRRFDLAWCDSCAAPDHSVMNRMWRERRPFGRVSIAIGGSLRRAAFGPILRKETLSLTPGAHP